MSLDKKIEIGSLCKWASFPKFKLGKTLKELENDKKSESNYIHDAHFIISDIVKDKFWNTFSCYYIETNEMFYFRLSRRNDNFDAIVYPKYLKNFIETL